MGVEDLDGFHGGALAHVVGLCHIVLRQLSLDNRSRLGPSGAWVLFNELFLEHINEILFLHCAGGIQTLGLVYDCLCRPVQE